MKITQIKQQQKDKNRVSMFINGKYSFSLTIAQWHEFDIQVGDLLDTDQLEEYKKLSNFGKAYNMALNYLVRRKRSEKEMKDYLKRKKIDIDDSDLIIKKLKKLKYIDDEEFANSWVRDRIEFKPSSNRKLYAELLKKGIDKSLIEKVIRENDKEQSSLIRLIETKQKQKRYQDDDKLMAYLCRNGFKYQDVKDAIKNKEE